MDSLHPIHYWIFCWSDNTGKNRAEEPIYRSQKPRTVQVKDSTRFSNNKENKTKSFHHHGSLESNCNFPTSSGEISSLESKASTNHFATDKSAELSE